MGSATAIDETSHGMWALILQLKAVRHPRLQELERVIDVLCGGSGNQCGSCPINLSGNAELWPADPTASAKP